MPTEEIEKNIDEGAQDIQAEGKIEEEQKEKEEFDMTAEYETEKKTTTKTVHKKKLKNVLK